MSEKTEGPPDRIVAAIEDGIRPPSDPRNWNRLYIVQTNRPCPLCGVAVGFLAASKERLPADVDAMNDDYETSVEAEAFEDYKHPVYLYCDSPICVWDHITEWEKLVAVVERWYAMDAPTWRDVRKGVLG